MNTLMFTLAVHVVLVVALVIFVQVYADRMIREKPSRIWSIQFKREYHTLLGLAVLLPELLIAAGLAWYVKRGWDALVGKGGGRG